VQDKVRYVSRITKKLIRNGKHISKNSLKPQIKIRRNQSVKMSNRICKGYFHAMGDQIISGIDAQPVYISCEQHLEELRPGWYCNKGAARCT